MRTIQDLKDEIRELSVERIAAVVNARAAGKLVQAADSLPNETRFGRTAVRDAAGAALTKLRVIESEIEQAQAELQRAEDIAQRPAIAARLSKALKLRQERVDIAKDIQSALDNLGTGLRAMDKNSVAMHACERSPAEHGISAIGGRDFHVCNLAARLRHPLYFALKKTTYSRLVRAQILPQLSTPDFEKAEAQVGAALCQHLQDELQRIDGLRREIA